MDAGVLPRIGASVERDAAAFEAFDEALMRVCYRVLLEREPELEALASCRAEAIPPDQEARIRARLEQFVSSEEYRAKNQTPAAAPHDGSLLQLRDLLALPREHAVNAFRKRCQTSYLGDGVALCRVLGRFHMFVQTTDRGFGVHVMHTGGWEMPLTEFITRNVKPGMRVIDVGANFGYYTLLMSELVGHQGHCAAFEPNLAIAKLLRDSLSVNGFGPRSRVFELALTDRDRGPMQFYIPHAEPKNARLETEVVAWMLAEGRCADVPTSSLDQLAGEIGKVDFLKIDAEGAEMDILKGMGSVLRAQRPSLVIEVNSGRSYDVAPTLNELIGLYGRMQHVADDGFAHDVDVETVKTTNVGEDWLLYFGRA